MKTYKVLFNQNKLSSEITTEASYTDQTSDFSLHAVFSGSERFRIGKKSMSVFPGNFIAINQGTVYDRSIYSYNISDTFSVSFSAKFLGDFQYNLSASEGTLLDEPTGGRVAGQNHFLETIYPCKGDIKYNLHHLAAHFHQNADELLLDDYIYHSLLLFYRLYYNEVLAKSDCIGASHPATRQELFKRLTQARDYMQSNYNQDVSLEAISEQACLSPTHLFRTFKQLYKCSPHQYLIQARLDNAKHMLKNTDYTLNEIVNMVGFTCPSTFIKLFKTKFRLTPGTYRNQVS